MKRKSVLISLLALLIFAVGIGLWQYLSPPIHDDIFYQHFCLPTTEDDFWSAEGDFITSYSQAAESVANHWLLVNGRLANALATFLILSPPWLLASLQALMAFLMMAGILYFGIGRKALCSSWICAILTLLIWKLLPWYNNMDSDDFNINYMWSSALVLAFVALILHPSYLDTWLKRWLWAMPSFFIGMMHEGFSIPVLGALFVLYIFPGIYPNSQNWPTDWRKRMLVPVIAFALGACCCIFAPSTIARIFRQHEELTDKSYLLIIKQLIPHLLSLLMYIAIVLLVMWKRGWSTMWQKMKSQAFWIVIFVVSFAMAVVVRLMSPRMVWFANVVFIIMSLQMLSTLGATWLRPLKGLAIAAIAVQVVLLWNILTIQAKVGAELTRAVTEFERRGDGYLYVDYTPQGDLPWWTFGLVHSYINTKMFNHQMAKSLPQLKGQKYVSALVIPLAFSHCKAFEDFPDIPGDNPFHGIYPTALSRQYVLPGTRIDVEFDEAAEFVNPLRRLTLSPGPGQLTVDHSYLLPMLLPDTVYAIYFKENLPRKVKEINLHQ